jgi:membrane fusion protein, multidrug efflux system
VQLVIPEDPERVLKGFVQNFDNRLNSSSGTIRARARFDNSDGSLVPGMFVSVRLASSQERKLILVNDRSISFDQSKTTVLTVTLENKVAYREIVLGAALAGKHVALKGLRDGDRVIVTGVQRVRPGALVAPKEYDPREEDIPAPEATAPVKED